MGALTNYTRRKQLEHTLRINAFTMPSALYLGLYIISPTNSYAGVEVSGNGYARVSVTFSELADLVYSNTSALLFEAAEAGWGNIVSIGLFDASSSGNLLYFGNLDEPITIGVNEKLSLPAGSVKVTQS